MIQNLKKRTEGFTIIEVMIVLVIAAVILLIVFLAVPALQRNSRNTQRKNDVAGILAAAGEDAANDNGKYAVADTEIEALVNLGFYTTANVTLTSSPAGATTNTTTDQTVNIVTNSKCNGVDAAAATRRVAVLYTAEPGQKLCQDS